MKNFERVTKNPETLGAFLASLPIAAGPWDKAFQETFCAGCHREDCDADGGCPHSGKRNNPAWWLGLEASADDAE